MLQDTEKKWRQARLWMSYENKLNLQSEPELRKLRVMTDQSKTKTEIGETETKFFVWKQGGTNLCQALENAVKMYSNKR